MEAGTILHWHVDVGDDVSAGDVLADIETDKATMELQSFDDGTVDQIIVGVGDQVRVGTTIALLIDEDEDEGDEHEVQVIDAPPNVVEAEVVTSGEPKVTPTPPPVSEESSSRGLRVSPVARRLAEEHGVDLQTIQGSGPSGRIIKRDILQLVGATVETTAAAHTIVQGNETNVVTQLPSTTPIQPLAPVSPWQENRTEPLSNMRQIIAQRLVESKQTIPHYQVTMSFDLDPLLEMRTTLNEQLATTGVKLSVNDFLVRCCALDFVPRTREYRYRNCASSRAGWRTCRWFNSECRSKKLTNDQPRISIFVHQGT